MGLFRAIRKLTRSISKVTTGFEKKVQQVAGDPRGFDPPPVQAPVQAPPPPPPVEKKAEVTPVKNPTRERRVNLLALKFTGARGINKEDKANIGRRKILR